MAIVLGIDEAGRGPVLGPMVVAGVAMDKDDEARLKKLGVTDSKMLSPRRRTELAAIIRKAAKGIEFIVVSAKQLDELMQIMTINQVEMNAMAQIINKLPADEIYIDLPSNSPAFIPELRAKINKSAKIMESPGTPCEFPSFAYQGANADSKLSGTPYPKIIAEHKADSTYTVVGAASIIAKTERDMRIEELHRKYSAYGDIGSGYPADERTMKFLNDYYAKNKTLPEEARKSWATAGNIMKKDAKKEKQQTLL